MAQARVNPVTLENLRRGISTLFVHLEKKGQSREGEWDFHNALYRQLEDERRHGLNERFWGFLVDELWNWRAIRGTSKHTKQGIRNEGLRRLPELQLWLERLAGNTGNDPPGIETLTWGDVSELFEVARQIKSVSSPTFASKLCHFLIPSAYFITDRTLVMRGTREYRDYWDQCRTAWLEQPNKQELQAELRHRMPHGCTPCRTYPWATKITEICQFT